MIKAVLSPEVLMGLSEEIPPDPRSLITSLRSIGYNLRTAVADLIDNSITAGAKDIQITSWWDGKDSYLTILDNGSGMSRPTLLKAMMLGSSDPSAIRAEHDLGRFGLGLKTASFSQCEKLTVVTREAGKSLQMACWDLDLVVKTRKWQLQSDPGEKTQSVIAQQTIAKAGTLVIWEKMDRIIGNSGSDREAGLKRFNHLMEDVRNHLGMVFHEFLTGRKAISITLNKAKVIPWDPFLAKHKATQIKAEETLKIKGHPFRITCYVLPHHSHLSTDEHREGGGMDGWNAHQGFYIYRNNRLLVAGDWLGLGAKKEEHYKLARIRIDLPNTLDSEWQIDVRKAKAQVPDMVRARLISLAAMTRTSASEVYRYRGKYLLNPNTKVHVNLWQAKQNRGKHYWKLNRDHPLYQAILEEYGGKTKNMETFIRLVESTIPVSSIAIASAESADSIGDMASDEREKIIELAKRLYDALLPTKDNRDRTIEEIVSMEPFNRLHSIILTELEEYAKPC